MRCKKWENITPSFDIGYVISFVIGTYATVFMCVASGYKAISFKVPCVIAGVVK